MKIIKVFLINLFIVFLLVECSTQFYRPQDGYILLSNPTSEIFVADKKFSNTTLKLLNVEVSNSLTQRNIPLVRNNNTLEYTNYQWINYPNFLLEEFFYQILKQSGIFKDVVPTEFFSSQIDYYLGAKLYNLSLQEENNTLSINIKITLIMYDKNKKIIQSTYFDVDKKLNQNYLKPSEIGENTSLLLQQILKDFFKKL